MFVTNNMIPCPYTHDTMHRWVLGSGLDGLDTLQVLCKECGHIAYSVSTPGLVISRDIDVDMQQAVYAGEETTTIRV